MMNNEQNVPTVPSAQIAASPMLAAVYSGKVSVQPPAILKKIDLPDNSVRPIKRTQKKFFLPTDKCCYCNRPFREGLEGTKEHITPKSKGGTDALKNLKPCCFECNQLKSNLDLKQFKTTVWNVIKILDGRYSLSLQDLKTVYENLRSV